MDINIGAITEAINNKADRDAGNLTAVGKHNVNTLSFPSDRYIDLTMLASGSEYTAPANGWFVTFGNFYRAGSFLQMGADGLILSSTPGSSGYSNLGTNLLVKKGESVPIFYSDVTISIFRFVYAEGEENV